MRKRKWLLIAGLVVALWLISDVFSGHLLSFFELSRLSNAVSTWEAKHIKNYQIVFDLATASLLRTRYRFVVEENQVTQASMKLMTSISDITYNPDNVPFTPTDTTGGFAAVSEYTVDSVFQRARVWFQDTRPIGSRSMDFEVDYDSEYGYIRAIQARCSGRISDCIYFYEVIEFKPLSG
ncbi:MAG: DUF6174 domain-containing protein [Anaerolineae bacterium]|nr:DUF6174 domain-containing protein [Anaerolineae bacterium]